MGKVYDGIDQRMQGWIARQPLFFVATAPLDGDGHVNVSPKAPIETLHVLDPHTVGYLDLVGSGAETIAHVRENGRIVFMLCAFEGPPRIVRLHGRAEVLRPHLDAWAAKKVRTGGPDALVRYQREKNERSIDGLPAVPLRRRAGARD
jgi:hypothetical protein